MRQQPRLASRTTAETQEARQHAKVWSLANSSIHPVRCMITGGKVWRRGGIQGRICQSQQRVARLLEGEFTIRFAIAAGSLQGGYSGGPGLKLTTGCARGIECHSFLTL